MGSNPIVGINICIIILKNLNMYVDTNNKTEYFIYIVTNLRIVRSENQTPINILGYPYFILRTMTNQYKIKRWGR